MTNTPTLKPKQIMKLFGQDARVVLSVVALIAFFLIGITGVLIAQRQRQVRGPVSPTAPESKPAAAVTQINTCTVALNVPFPSPTSVPTVIPTPSPSLAPSPTPTIIPSPSPRPSPSTVTYTCNSRCTTTAQCQTANAGYVCSGGYCRLGGNTSSTTCTYKCNSNCTTDTECKTANSDYMCYQGKCRMAANPTSTTCAYSCPALTTGTPTTTCAPAANQNGTITWAWTPISGHNSTTQYQIQILNSANQVVGEDKGCKPGDEYYNCWQGTCKYTSYHLPGTYKARIKACTASCPSTSTLGFKVTTSKQIIVCK